MIGTWEVFLRSLIIWASSMPVTPGIRMSRMSKRELIHEQRKQRLVGGFGFDQPVGRVVQDGFENGEVLWLIVHDQDIDRPVA